MEGRMEKAKCFSKRKQKPMGLCISIFALFIFVSVLSASAQVTQTTSADGITVQFTLSDLTVSEVTRDNVRYQEARYADSRFTIEPGNPKVPVTRLLLGIPATANIEDIDVSAAPYETRSGIRLVPVPIYDVHESVASNRRGSVSEPAHQGSGNLTPTETPLTTSQRWEESGSAYSSNVGSASYPGLPLARVVREGYIRSQRVIALSLYPVQYFPKTRQLRLYPRFTVNIRFNSNQLPVASNQLQESSSLETGNWPLVTDSEVFERALSRQLLNAEQAARFRVGRTLVPAAPSLFSNVSNTTRYKLFVEETGVYAITAASLARDWGIELIGADPARLRLTHGNRDVPIYVSGAADRRFDSEDAIFFLGHKPKNPYSRWNIYWLTVDNSQRILDRVPQVDASPTDPTATQVPTFRSKVHFEEDYLTNNLEFASHDGDKHDWFAAFDFWYWDGIKNGGDGTEMRLAFPLYDVAKSFDPSHISVDLQGGTPVEHEILVAINGVRIDVAEWNSQDSITVEQTLRTWDTLKSAVSHQPSAVSEEVSDEGTSLADGQQPIADSHLNILSLARVDYNVDEDTTRYPYHVYLNRFSVEYTRLFRAVADELWFRSPTEGETGSPSPYTRTQPAGGRKLQYRIEAFRDPNVHIFETDGTYLTARMQGVWVEEGDGSYNALFQALDTRSTQFISVSDTALRRPPQIEIVEPSDLATATHGVDYLVVTHPKFLSAAERLAAWRATSGGGGYRTKVVTTDDIYNSYGDGAVSPKAIKSFLTHAYQSWAPPALSYVVLLGDGTYDFRGVDTDIHFEPPELDGYIPTHYIRTDSFGRTASDHWYATVSGHDEFTDFYIGRLSVETVSEAEAVVSKILTYEQSPPNDDWRRRIISVADDEVSNSGDFIFKKSLDEIAKDHTRLGYETVEIFLEDITDEVEARPDDFDVHPQRLAKDMIIEALGEGAVLAQYAGHGGNTVWAHEIIFDNVSVDQVEETDKIPFMLVLSCYNGYFDKPGEPSMAEKLLRKERGGIIGMLSATRLTYASGNDALNRIIFDMIFKRNVRQLGPLSFDSKTELLITEGTGQIDVMLEYTLFGDPALKMALADGEIQPTIETKTVAPGDTLRIAPGHILKKVTSNQLPVASKEFSYLETGNWKLETDSDFDGTLTVKAVFPGETAVSQGVAGPVEYYTGDVVLTQTLPVSDGAYQAVNFTVPQNIASGDAHVEYYAQSDTTIAVGGDGFTVNVPKILDIRPELVSDDQFRISVQISDDGPSEVTSPLRVVLEWRNLATRASETVNLIEVNSYQLTVNSDKSPLESSETSLTENRQLTTDNYSWWTTPEPLDAPTDGSAIRYYITVTDADGNITQTNRLEYYPYVYPNLSVVQVQRSDMIRYGYNLERKQWFLTADVQVEGNLMVTGSLETSYQQLTTNNLPPIEISFFNGNPDIDEDMLVDSDAAFLGSARIQPSDWLQRTPLSVASKRQVYEPDPLNVLPIATATLNLTDPLRSGIHDIFVYIDAAETEADLPGEVVENDEEDNIAYRRISVNMGVVDAATSGQIMSLDGNCVVTVPPGAFQDAAVLAIRSLTGDSYDYQDKTDHGNHDNHGQSLVETLKPPLPGNSVYGYEIAVSSQPDSHQPSETFSHQIEDSNLSDPSLPTADSRQPIADSQIAIDLNFDYGILRAQLAEEILGSPEGAIEDVTGNPLDMETVAARAREMGVYMFNSTLGYWTRLPSQPLTDASGTLRWRIQVTNINAENVGGGQLRNVRIQPEGAPVGKYVLFFTGPRTYRIFHAPFADGENDPKNLGELEMIATAEQLTNFSIDYPNWTHGFSIDMEQDFDDAFAFGDVWTFNVTAINQILEAGPDSEDPSQQDLRWHAAGFRDTNRGAGTINYIELSSDTNIPEDRWIVFFLTDTEFQIEGQRTGVLRSEADNMPLRGTVGQPFAYPPYGLRLQLTQGQYPFLPGDRFHFETRPVGTVRATTDRLGPITFIYSDDTVPPDIQLTIGNQQHFVPGDATDPEPLIGATLTDPSGLDYLTRPLLLELGRVSGEYEPIAPEAYQLAHQPGSNQLVLTYPSPELEPREYELRLTASDVHGNTDTKRITFQVHDNLQLLSFLNYPNPFPRKTMLTCELTAPADSLTVKIYTLSGRMIREISIPATPGFLMVEWDGRDADGVEVANGVYYAKLKIKREGEKDITEILKMMKLR